MMPDFIGGQLDVPRVVFCVCGWAERFPTLKAAIVALTLHLEDGVEGCDHVATIEDGEA